MNIDDDLTISTSDHSLLIERLKKEIARTLNIDHITPEKQEIARRKKALQLRVLKGGKRG
jgi:hypothetical protein